MTDPRSGSSTVHVDSKMFSKGTPWKTAKYRPAKASTKGAGSPEAAQRILERKKQAVRDHNEAQQQGFKSQEEQNAFHAWEQKKHAAGVTKAALYSPLRVNLGSTIPMRPANLAPGPANRGNPSYQSNVEKIQEFNKNVQRQHLLQGSKQFDNQLSSLAKSRQIKPVALSPEEAKTAGSNIRANTQRHALNRLSGATTTLNGTRA